MCLQVTPCQLAPGKNGLPNFGHQHGVLNIVIRAITIQQGFHGGLRGNFQAMQLRDTGVRKLSTKLTDTVVDEGANCSAVRVEHGVGQSMS